MKKSRIFVSYSARIDKLRVWLGFNQAGASRLSAIGNNPWRERILDDQ